MSEITASRFSCGGCAKSYTWKAELAGRRVKCKCGHVMTVPQSPPVQEQEDDLYDIAPEDSSVKPKLGRAPLAPDAPRAPLAPVAKRAPLTPIQSTRESSQTSRVGTAVVAGAGAGAARGIPIAYQQGATQRDRDRMSLANIMDMKRDVYAPIVTLIVGFALYVGYYAIRYEMSAGGVALTALGLGLLTAFKALLLIGFAFVAAGPLGVSFGGVWTATLKLAAIAVFADGVATWIEAGGHKMGAGFYAPMLSFPIVLGIYWAMLIYLFDMDAGDSWMVVIVLAVFDMIVRTVLILLLLRLVLGMGGVSGAAVPVPAFGGGGGGARAPINPQVARITEMKETGQLEEARKFIEGGRQMALGKPVEAWYAAGCKNVWFSVGRDFNGKLSAGGVVVELPKDRVKDKAKREQCYQILKEYYDEHNFSYDADELKDVGDPYLFVRIRG